MVCAVALHKQNAVLGLVSLEGYVLEQHYVTIPPDPNGAAQLMGCELQRLAKSRPAHLMYAAAICTTSCIRPKRLIGKPCETLQPVATIAEHLSLVLGVPVEMGSVLHGTMLHEMNARNFDKIRSAVLLHISNDVVGAIWANGDFLHQSAGRLGHICIDPKGGICSCGRRGCLSMYASDEAALVAFQEISSNPQLQKIEDLYQLFH